MPAGGAPKKFQARDLDSGATAAPKHVIDITKRILAGSRLHKLVTAIDTRWQTRGNSDEIASGLAPGNQKVCRDFQQASPPISTAAMEALLGSVGADNSCSSIAELQDRLRAHFGTHVTESSATHFVQTFDLRPSTSFSIPVTDSGNGALEQAATLGHTIRQINAFDVIMNQPQDDSEAQSSVAKHIVAALSQVDSSNWTIRAVSRGDQGWIFTYICKNSMGAWTRQCTRIPPKIPIAAWSAKDSHDPVNMSRVACFSQYFRR